jgi:hypothetical protein
MRIVRRAINFRVILRPAHIREEKKAIAVAIRLRQQDFVLQATICYL